MGPCSSDSLTEPAASSSWPRKRPAAERQLHRHRAPAARPAGAGGIAARLSRFGTTATGTRDEVRAGWARHAPPKGKIPFTPRAKKTLELSLREALSLHHNYIGTEHILLGLAREGEGVAAQILTEHAADLEAVRQAVLDLLRRQRPCRAAAGCAGGTTLPSASRVSPARRMRRTTRAGWRPRPRPTPGWPKPRGWPGAAGRSHHLLLAALADPDSAAARTLAALGVNLDEARAALREADIAGTSDEPPEQRGRRRMAVRVAGESLTLEATDPSLVALARAAIEAAGDQAAERAPSPVTCR